MNSFATRFRALSVGVVAACYVGGLVIIAILAQFSGVDPTIISNDALLPPSIVHPLGTDELGRDVLVGIIFGIQISLGVGFSAAFAATSLGIMIGGISGYYGGILDLILMRITEVFQVVPSFILAAGDRGALGPRPYPHHRGHRATRLAAGRPGHARRGHASGSSWNLSKRCAASVIARSSSWLEK